MFGGDTTYGREFDIVHGKNYSTIRSCPFAAETFDEVKHFLNRLSIQEINRKISKLRKDLYVVETLRYPAAHYLTRWADFAEKIEYLRVLWNDHVFALIRLPLEPDAKIVRWIQAFRDCYSGHNRSDDKDGGATDDSSNTVSPASSTPEISTVKWRQAAENVNRQRPGIARMADKIILSANTNNIPDGATVVFRIYATAGTGTPESLDAKVNNNVAEAGWTVKKDGEQHKTELEFDANYQGVKSLRVKIPLQRVVKFAIYYSAVAIDISKRLSAEIDWKDEANKCYQELDDIIRFFKTNYPDDRFEFKYFDDKNNVINSDDKLPHGNTIEMGDFLDGEVNVVVAHSGEGLGSGVDYITNYPFTDQENDFSRYKLADLNTNVKAKTGVSACYVELYIKEAQKRGRLNKLDIVSNTDVEAPVFQTAKEYIIGKLIK
jgi:hypothetical protein